MSYIFSWTLNHANYIPQMSYLPFYLSKLLIVLKTYFNRYFKKLWVFSPLPGDYKSQNSLFLNKKRGLLPRMLIHTAEEKATSRKLVAVMMTQIITLKLKRDKGMTLSLFIPFIEIITD